MRHRYGHGQGNEAPLPHPTQSVIIWLYRCFTTPPGRMDLADFLRYMKRVVEIPHQLVTPRGDR